MKRISVILLLIIIIGCQEVDIVESESTENTIESKEAVVEVQEKDPIIEKIDSMTLHEKICQLFIVTPEELTSNREATKVGDVFKDALKSYPVSGIILFRSNIVSEEQLKMFISDAKALSDIPLFISIDQEGGAVERLNENVGFPTLHSMYSYKDDGEDTAYTNAKLIAQGLSEYGINLNFAPVADVWSNKQNTVIGRRAYSDEYNEAALLVSSAVKGFHDGGVLCVLKHFPGHGDTLQDSHHELAVVTKEKESLDREEMLPFKAGILEGADMVMIGHLYVSSIDEENPAVFSKAIIEEYLKEELKFQGIVITDSFKMGATTSQYTSEEAVVKAVKSGVDIILMPDNLELAVGALEKAVMDGIISEEMINDKVYRILTLKEKRGL